MTGLSGCSGNPSPGEDSNFLQVVQYVDSDSDFVNDVAWGGTLRLLDQCFYIDDDFGNRYIPIFRADASVTYTDGKYAVVMYDGTKMWEDQYYEGRWWVSEGGLSGLSKESRQLGRDCAAAVPDVDGFLIVHDSELESESQSH